MTPGHGRMLAFHGGARGAGKTFLAQNLAATWSRRGRQVVLVDLDRHAQGVYQTLWNLPTGPTLADSSEWPGRLDENLVRGYFPQSPSGVSVAALALSAQAAMGVAGTTILHALRFFQQAFDVVLIDGLEGWDPLTLMILDAADQVLMVCPADLASAKMSFRDTLHYQTLKFSSAKINLLLNRADVPAALTKDTLGHTLPGYACLAAFPYDPYTTEAIHQQQDLCSLYPRSAFAKHMQQCAQNLDAALALLPWTAMENDPGMVPQDPGPAGETVWDRNAIKERIHSRLLENSELKSGFQDLASKGGRQTWLREKVESVATGLMAQEVPELLERSEREQMVREVVDEALGLGPLEDLLNDPGITEIMVNRRDQIYIERQGRLELTPKHFLSDKQLMTVIERIVAPLGRRIDESQPYVDARLPDGSRVHAVIPPLAIRGPVLTIRKFIRQGLAWEDWVRMGALSQAAADFLDACVLSRRNILISGGTGAGKTTLLNTLAGRIRAEERIITIEDAAELELPQPHVVTLEARSVNLEGKGAVSIRDLVRNSLRMRPDRIVIGECRGGEALDMLQAMNTGHDGSLTTVHANSPQDSLSRLETMVLMAGVDLPWRAIREQIVSAIQIIIQLTRMPDGARRVTQVSEIAGLSEGSIKLRDLFSFQASVVKNDHPGAGELKPTGQIPECLKRMQAQGIQLNSRLFKAG